MQNKYYLYSPTLAFGESKFPRPGAASLDSFQFENDRAGVTMPAGSGMKLGTPPIGKSGRSFTFTKSSDSATPGLWRAMTNGTSIAVVTLEAWGPACGQPRRDQPSRRLMTRVTMRDVVVESLSTTPNYIGPGTGVMYTLNYVSIQFDAISCDNEARSKGLSGDRWNAWNIGVERGA
jgi:type VI protein secretion system component Hcp